MAQEASIPLDLLGAVSCSDKVMCSDKAYRKLGSVMGRSKAQKAPTIQEACMTIFFPNCTY